MALSGSPRSEAEGRRNPLWLYASAAIVGIAGLVGSRSGAVDYFLSETHCYQSVRTHAAAGPHVDCFTVAPSGVFSKVFRSEPASSLAQAARPGYVIPGLWDGHGHLVQLGESLNSVDLFGSSSFDQVRRRVKDYLAENSSSGTKQEWVRGIGWDQMTLGHMPTAVSSDRRWAAWLW